MPSHSVSYIHSATHRRLPSARRQTFRLLAPALLILIVGGLLFLRLRFSSIPALRLAIYLFPLASAFLLLIRVSVRPTQLLQPFQVKYFRSVFLTYFSIIAGSLLVLVPLGVHKRFFQESLFLFSPLITSFLFFVAMGRPESRRSCDQLLALVFVGLYLASCVPEMDAIARLFQWETFRTSTIATESGLAFSFGAMVVHFASRRNGWLTVLTALFLVICYKRIALAATVVGILVLWMTSRVDWGSKRTRRMAAIFAVATNLTLLWGMLQFTAGRYDQLIDNWLGVPANQFTMGRRYVQSQALAGLNTPRNPVALAVALPKGLGSSSDYLIRSGLQRGLLNSDLLKALIEFGMLGCIGWIYAFYRVHTFSSTALALAAYWNVLWLTDNTLIYFEVSFVFYTLVGLSLLAHHQPRNTRRAGTR